MTAVELRGASSNAVSSSSRAAVDPYDRGVRAFRGFGGDTIDCVRAALGAALRAGEDRRVARRANPGRRWLGVRL